MRAHRLILVLLVAAACGGDLDLPETDGGVDVDGPTAPLIADPLYGLPTGGAQWAALCAKGYGDSISQAFCTGTAPPALTSLADLRTLLGLTIDPNVTGAQPRVRFTFTGHSTALPMRRVSPLNPRLFVMTIPNTTAPNPRYQVLAFARGETVVELVANDPAAGTLRFFLLRFHLACEQDPAGCNHADLYTPTIEAGWTGYTLYDDDTIKDTTMDCLQCHQPGGPSSPKQLRMQELANPWAHWFYEERPANLAMMQYYLTARPAEPYGGVPTALVRPSRPVALQRIVSNNGFAVQPNVFDTTVIQTELQNGGVSATWNALYDRTVAGSEIAVPYYGDPFDPTKLAARVQDYQDVMSGALPRAALPDLADVFLDGALDEMSHVPKPGLDGRQILDHMCRGCHNSRLDQTLRRAQFNVETLGQMSRVEKDQAIARLQLPAAHYQHMPPARFHTLSQAEIDLVIAELRR